MATDSEERYDQEFDEFVEELSSFDNRLQESLRKAQEDSALPSNWDKSTHQNERAPSVSAKGEIYQEDFEPEEEEEGDQEQEECKAFRNDVSYEEGSAHGGNSIFLTEKRSAQRSRYDQRKRSETHQNSQQNTTITNEQTPIQQTDQSKDYFSIVRENAQLRDQLRKLNEQVTQRIERNAHCISKALHNLRKSAAKGANSKKYSAADQERRVLSAEEQNYIAMKTRMKREVKQLEARKRWIEERPVYLSELTEQIDQKQAEIHAAKKANKQLENEVLGRGRELQKLDSQDNTPAAIFAIRDLQTEIAFFNRKNISIQQQIEKQSTEREETVQKYLESQNKWEKLVQLAAHYKICLDANSEAEQLQRRRRYKHLKECVGVLERGIATVEKINRARLEWARRDRDETLREVRKNDELISVMELEIIACKKDVTATSSCINLSAQLEEFQHLAEQEQQKVQKLNFKNLLHTMKRKNRHPQPVVSAKSQVSVNNTASFNNTIDVDEDEEFDQKSVDLDELDTANRLKDAQHLLRRITEQDVEQIATEQAADSTLVHSTIKNNPAQSDLQVVKEEKAPEKAVSFAIKPNFLVKRRAQADTSLNNTSLYEGDSSKQTVACSVQSSLATNNLQSLSTQGSNQLDSLRKQTRSISLASNQPYNYSYNYNREQQFEKRIATPQRSVEKKEQSNTHNQTIPFSATEPITAVTGSKVLLPSAKLQNSRASNFQNEPIEISLGQHTSQTNSSYVRPSQLRTRQYRQIGVLTASQELASDGYLAQLNRQAQKESDPIEKNFQGAQGGETETANTTLNNISPQQTQPTFAIQNSRRSRFVRKPDVVQDSYLEQKLEVQTYGVLAQQAQLI